MRAATGSAKRDTRAEVSLQTYFKSARLYFRRDVATLPGRPDIVFTKSRVAVFVDGDFWHGRNLKQRLARLAAGHNSDYWTQKILTNRARDRRTRDRLRRMGWKVIRAWESDIKRDIAYVGVKIESAVRARDQALARIRATAL